MNNTFSVNFSKLSSKMVPWKSSRGDGCFFPSSCFNGDRPFLLTAAWVAQLQARWVLVHHDEAIERFYTTTAWRKCRQSFLTEKGGLCELCLGRGLIVPAVHVHHKIPITPMNLNDPAITLSHDNLMALCENCHQDQHRRKRWRCDEFGRITL